MIDKYWNFLNWLSRHKLYYLAVVIYHVLLIIGLGVFVAVIPFLWLADKITSGYHWLRVYYKMGLIELKRGK